MRFLFIFLICSSAFSQNPPDSEIFLFKINSEENKLEISEGTNISENKGYDNQPSFYNNELLIFAKTRNNGTDIAGFGTKDSREFWISQTGGGGEYSPQRIPGTNDVAAVRLDTTGLQRLYRYDWKTGESSVLIPDLKVGYFAFHNENQILAAVLTDSLMDLMSYNLDNNKSKKILAGVGRSLHQVPNTNSMSYTIPGKDGKSLDLYLLDLKKQDPESFYLCTLPEGVSDYTWLDENRIILGQDNKIYLYDSLNNSKWIAVADLSEYNLKNISRITVNQNGTLLALAAELVSEE